MEDPIPDQRPDPPQRARLAYDDKAFLNSPDGRALRILAEYQEPLSRLRRARVKDTIVFFGSARILPQDQARRMVEEAYTQPGDHAGQDVQQRRRIAESALEMSAYYEDARSLAAKLTLWTKSLPGPRHRFVVTSGGGPGIMEAANRGAFEAGGKTIGLNIHLPMEQHANPYLTPELNFEFHYFFMRKFWFAYLAKALVIFPGGFGTLDEMFEFLTLAQTEKLARPISVVMYGSRYWNQILNLEAMAEHGLIARSDLNIFRFADTPEEAFDLLKEDLTHHHLEQQQPSARTTVDVGRAEQDSLGPDIARTRP